MKKLLSVVAVTGMIASLSISALAADRFSVKNDTKSPVASETYISKLGDGVGRDDVMADFVTDDVDGGAAVRKDV